MIGDIRRFTAGEEPYWKELEALLTDLETHAERSLALDEAKRFHYLYQRASADLARVATLPHGAPVRNYLEPLVARAYAEIHESREKPQRLQPLNWFLTIFPQTFRRHVRAFWMTLLTTLLGAVFGALMIYAQPQSKTVLLPFMHLQDSPAERVAYEESAQKDRMKPVKGRFSAMLMTHNTHVAILTLALGVTWGAGTLIILFSNGVILGAVVADYVLAGQTRFVMGWLLPHGVIEIPAILIAAQAGFILAWALIGRGAPFGVRSRLRAAAPDVVTLVFGAALLLVWAGIIESFLSQYHNPVLPYELKIAFGLAELALLIVFLARSGRKTADRTAVAS